MKKVFHFFKEEFLEMLPPTIFFLVVFHVVAFIRGLSVQEFGITLTTAGYATVGGLIVGKAILIANKFRFLHIFKKNRRIYTVLWKVLIYSVVVVLFQYLEHILPAMYRGSTFGEAHHHLATHIIWPKFWATHIMMALFLAIYTAIVEMIDAIGRDRFWEVFLGTSPEAAEGEE